MNIYADKVNSHAALKQVEAALDTMSLIINHGIDEAYVQDIDRIHNVLLQTRITIRNTDPYFVQIHILDALCSNALNQIVSNLSAFHTSPNPAHITQCNQVIDAHLIGYLSTFIYPKTGREINGYRAASEAYKKLIEDYIDDLKRQQSELETAINEASTSVESNLKDSQEEVKELILLLNKNHTEHVVVLQDKANALFKQIEDSKQNYEGIVKEHVKDIENIAGAVSERSLIYGFQKIADEEKTSKEKWQVWAVRSIIGLIVYTVIASGLSLFYSFTWENMLVRLSGVFTIGILIAYCANRASGHGKIERYSRKMELELASLGPYFSGTDKEKLFDIRKELAMRFFGKDDVTSNSTKDEKQMPQEKLIDFVIEIVKKIKT